jgi:hypothetical protein
MEGLLAVDIAVSEVPVFNTLTLPIYKLRKSLRSKSMNCDPNVFKDVLGLDEFGLADVCQRLGLETSDTFSAEDLLRIGKESAKTVKELEKPAALVPSVGTVRFGASLIELTVIEALRIALPQLLRVFKTVGDKVWIKKDELPKNMRLTHVTRVPLALRTKLKAATADEQYFYQSDIEQHKRNGDTDTDIESDSAVSG